MTVADPRSEGRSARANPGLLGTWSTPLRDLPPRLAEAVGPWLPRLAALAGPTRRSVAEPDGDPDGYGDLARRGPYERLLTAEWAVARSLPMEFLRRAAMGEHLFLELQRRRHRGGRRLLALFDAGPEQLGNPRLAHLAWLLVLTERAARAGAAFVWSALHSNPGEQPEGGLAADPASALEHHLRHLLAGRSRRGVAQQVAAWREALGPPVAGEERWWIGGETMARAVAEGRDPADVISRVDEPGHLDRVDHLEVWVDGSGAARARRSCRLDLPSQVVRGALLEGHFDRPAKQGRNTNVADRLLRFSSGDVKVLHVDADRGLVAGHVGRAGRAGRIPSRVEEDLDPARLLALGHHGDRFVSVAQRHGELIFRRLGSRKQRAGPPITLPAPAELAMPDPDADASRPSLPGPCVPVHSGWLALFADPEGRLFLADFQRNLVERMAGRVHTLTSVEGDAYFTVEHDPEADGDPTQVGYELFGDLPGAAVVYRSGNKRMDLLDMTDDPRCRIFLGHGDHGKPPLVCVESRPGVFRFAAHGDQLHNSQTGTVVGVACGDYRQPCLLILDDDAKVLRKIGRSLHQVLIDGETPIVRVEVGVGRPLVAVLYANGRVQVISKGEGAVKYDTGRGL